MTIEDYDDAVRLWNETEGVKLRDADSREGIGRYLERNPDLSFIASDSVRVVGTIMAGHDGKRGYIQHLAIANGFRRNRIASTLVAMCLDALRHQGILKSHVMILDANEPAKSFWSKLGWERRSDIEIYSFVNGGGKNT